MQAHESVIYEFLGELLISRWNFWADVFHSDSRSSILHWRLSVHMFAYENCFVQYLRANLYSQFIALNVIFFKKNYIVKK